MRSAPPRRRSGRKAREDASRAPSVAFSRAKKKKRKEAPPEGTSAFRKTRDATATPIRRVEAQNHKNSGSPPPGSVSDLQRRVRPSRDAEEARRAKLLADAPRFDEARTARRLTPAGALASMFSASGKKDDRRRDRRRVDGTAFAFHPDDILAYAFETCVVDEQGAFERASPEDGGAREVRAGADAFATLARARAGRAGRRSPNPRRSRTADGSRK